MLIDLIQLFIGTIPNQLAELKNALAEDDAETLANAAHAIKGITGTFFADKVKTLSSQLKYDARHHKRDDLAMLTAKLTEASTQLSSELQQRQSIKP